MTIQTPSRPTALTIRPLQAADIAPIAAAFLALGWNKPASQYEGYLADQSSGKRSVLVALLDGTFAGYLTVNWQADYPPFIENSIPEIQDFNVLPDYRRQGIGARLMDEAERLAAQRSPAVGLGVGLYSDYGSAQRMYVKRGYIPDGRGLFYGHDQVIPGAMVRADDDLVIYLMKALTPPG